MERGEDFKKENFGPWMMVQKQKRKFLGTNGSGDTREKLTSKNKKVEDQNRGSRYEIISNIIEMLRTQVEGMERGKE